MRVNLPYPILISDASNLAFAVPIVRDSGDLPHKIF